MGFGGFVKSVVTAPVKGGKALAGAVSDGVSELEKFGEDGFKIATKTLNEIDEIASDPKGYLEKELTELAWEQVKSAVTVGLDEVAEKLARDAGLGDLIDGVDAFAEVIEDAVAIAMRFIECAKWLENPTFLGLCGVIYAAREMEILTSKSQCLGFINRPDVKYVIGDVPVMEMLPCAIEVAFLAPLPADIAGAKSATTGSGSPGAKAKQKLEQSAGESVAVDFSFAIGLMKFFIPHNVNAVSRTPDHVDIFMVRPDGYPVTAARHPSETNWRGWWMASEAKTSPESPITAISRTPDTLDIFVVAESGHILTAGWESSGGWSKWWQIGSVKTEPGSRIGAVSRANNRIEIFVTGHDRQVQTTSRNFDGGGWGPWTSVNGGLAAPGAPVTAVNRTADSVDVFVIGEDGRVWNTSRLYSRMKTPWRNWHPVLDVRAMPKTQIGAASYADGHIDLFLTDADGNIRSAARAAGDDKWGGWWHISEGRSNKNSPITAISRANNHLDLFTVGLDNRIWTSAWWPTLGGWRRWSPIGDLKVLPATRIDAISSAPNKLEIFVRGSDRAVYWIAWNPQTGTWGSWERLS